MLTGNVKTWTRLLRSTKERWQHASRAPCTAYLIHSRGCGTPLRIRAARQCFHTTKKLFEIDAGSTATEQITKVPDSIHVLPRACPGCGALIHNDSTNPAGFYGRKAVKKLALQAFRKHAPTDESNIAQDKLGDATDDATDGDAQIHEDPLSSIVCDRCNTLANESAGEPIIHPSINSIAAMIEESPFHHNHVYHVLDAADFPASLIPNIFEQLNLVQQRSQNRRAKSTMYKGGRTTTVSFIITRSDILLPSSEQTDKLMPWFAKTLRHALGIGAENARMGNVHLVSAKRGWWTKEIKEEIRHRGGGNWMVGKANVGKSNLFEALYPKGSKQEDPDFTQLRKDAGWSDIDETSTVLLPPAQPLVPYPKLPLVSSLPGTTASPIRLPFTAVSGKRGELIDLPGLYRSPYDPYVKAGFQQSLVMTQRPRAEKVSLRPHQSLLLGGGLIRVTPLPYGGDPSNEPSRDSSPGRELVILAHPFVPSEVGTHVTSTAKAQAIQEQSQTTGITTTLAEGSGSSMKSAGIFTLENDVTKVHARRLLMQKPQSERKVDNLPFRVYATDIVLEGIGWVELTAQVRISRNTQQLPSFGDPRDDDFSDPFDQEHASQPIPQVEIFTPEGKGVLKRDTMGASTIISGHPIQIEKDRRMMRPSGNRRNRTNW